MTEEIPVIQTEKNSSRFPTWDRMDKAFVISALGFIIALFPGIVSRLYALGGEQAMYQAQAGVVYNVVLNAATVLAALILGLLGLKMARENVSVRALAILTLVICVFKILLQV